MPENPHQPKESDAVLGGQNPSPIYGAVLGGIEGIKKRLASPVVEVKIAALSDALKYGEKGLDLVVQALHDESMQVKFAAYSLLKERQEPLVQQLLRNFLLFFEFEVVTVDAKGQINSRSRHLAQYFTEDLGKGVLLEMVLIPGGTFLMGSLATVQEWRDGETPQHQVTVQRFFMGKYPVTQAQWEAVAALPQINIPLDPAPSRFKEANRPVECVSWHEAQEFCARVGQKTGSIYRLPSESEWEYSCRAGTTTRFHFGERINTQLANFNGNHTNVYAPKGIYRQKTTPVGGFPPNAFGLYDMHGNVWEWCADFWHKDYNGAPSDGSVWESDVNSSLRMLRGGSWNDYPTSCLSASRNCVEASDRYYVFGFRVACSATLTD